MAGKKKPTKPEPEEQIQEAEVVEQPQEEKPAEVPDPKSLVETPPGHPTLQEFKTDPTAITRARRELTQEEIEATVECANRQIEVANPEDRKAAQRYFMARNMVERVLMKLTGGELTMEKVDNMNQETMEKMIAAMVAQHLAGGQVQQQAQAPQEEQEKPFFDTTAGTAVKYGAAMAGGAAILYGGQKLFGGDAEDVAALALNLADAW